MAILAKSANGSGQKDIITGQPVQTIGPTPEERDDEDFVDLPRIAFGFNRRDYGRLRQLIDVLNHL